MADLNIEIAASLGRFEREMAKVEARLSKLANGIEKKASAQLGRVDASAAQTAANLNRMVQSADKAGGALGGMGNKIGGISTQFGDLAVQIGGGTDAMRALAMQGPQILGYFGAIGATAGAATAILLPMASALMQTAFDSKSLADRMNELEASTDAMQEAVKLAAMPISELRDKYGDLADEVARANGAMAAFTAAQAGVQLKGAAGATAALFPDAKLPTRVFGMADNEWAAVQEAQMRKLMKATGGTREQTEELAMALRRLESANGPEAVYRDAENLLGIMSKLPDATERLAPQFTAIDGLMLQALKQMEAQRAEVVRLREEYDATTAKMRGLAADLSKAEAERAKASVAGKAEEVAQWDRVIEKIREMIYETRAAASETDTLFERMTKGAQGFMERASGFVSGVTGRMAGSTAIAIGKEYAGMKERPNREELKNLVGVDPATVAWCAAFMNAVLDKAGSKGTGSLSARSFLNWGTATDNPGYGDVVVLKRGRSSSAGHVGFYEGMNPDGTIRVFGGNQSNGVGTANFKSSDVLGYRRAPAPDQYVDPQTAADAERIAIAGERAAEAEKEQKRLASENAAALKKEVAERERKAEAMQKAREALSESLVSQQKAAELERQRADQIAAINAGPGSDAEKAAAIAQINAEMQRQITIMALMEEAKRRQVNIDTLMVGSTMTYRQAIEALGETAKQKVISDQQMQASAQSLAEAQAFANDQMRSLQDGFIDAIIAGESFTDVLKNVAAQMAKAWAQAALFGSGPLASQGGGGLFAGLFKNGGLLSQVFGGFRASGGPVSSGRAYVVGERGPEIIVPRSAGQVIPNHRLGGGRQTVNLTVDVRGATGNSEVRQMVAQGVQQGMAQVRREVPAIMADRQKRGPD